MEIGEWGLWYDSEGELWIENKDGEGGQFSEEKFAETIKKFFEENY
jgi:hypothetical protein